MSSAYINLKNEEPIDAVTDFRNATLFIDQCKM